jgi:hypothetical protein
VLLLLLLLLLRLFEGRSFLSYCVALFKHSFSCFPLTVSRLLLSNSEADFNHFVLTPRI